jgi:hypothetical protein
MRLERFLGRATSALRGRLDLNVRRSRLRHRGLLCRNRHKRMSRGTRRGTDLS